MFWLYNLFALLLSPLWVTWMVVRTRRRGTPPNWRERQGSYDFRFEMTRPRYWIHAVSVGEVIAASTVIQELKNHSPNGQIFVTTTTSSGYETAQKNLAPLVDKIAYFPIDLAPFTLSAVGRIRPTAVAIMETELWFNFLWACKELKVPVLLINGRISDRSFPRALKLKFFYRSVLKMVTACLMQTEQDAERIRALGAPHVEVVGNTKFDEAAGVVGDRDALRESLGFLPNEVVIIVGSTRGSAEQALVAKAILALAPGPWRVIHAPRHLETVPELTELYEKPALRSKCETGKILILDTYGELSALYSAADIAVIGGGFSDLGGQNLVQPLAAGLPVLRGPHFQNFREVAQQADAAGATEVCPTAEDLTRALECLIADATKRSQMGAAARKIVQSNLGASAEYARRIVAASSPRSGSAG